MTLCAPLKRAKLASMHLAFILFATFAVYSYRDLWPLCTFTITPADINEGPFLWARMAALIIVAVVVPLFIPRQYIPVDPKVNTRLFLLLVELIAPSRIPRRCPTQSKLAPWPHSFSSHSWILSYSTHGNIHIFHLTSCLHSVTTIVRSSL